MRWVESSAGESTLAKISSANVLSTRSLALTGVVNSLCSDKRFCQKLVNS